MPSNCLKCRKNTKVKSAQVKGRIMLLSKCTLCDIKKSTFINKQEGRRLIYKLGLKTPLSKILLFGNILF